LKARRWVFPIGSVLTVCGVPLCGLLEWQSFYDTQDWESSFLTYAAFFSLFVGSCLSIVGSILDKRRLDPQKAKVRGVVCVAWGGTSLLLLALFGNSHGWTFTLFFPGLVGIVTGLIFFF
jgi:hypothetical protein